MTGKSRIPAGLAEQMTPEVLAFVESLLGRIDALEEQLAKAKKSPQNSSLPPSTQHPHAKPAQSKPKSKSKRKRGGQPGHRRHLRTLLPAEQCTRVVPLYPDACRRCGEPLAGEDPEPIRHQVWELPKIEPDVTEYRLHRRGCGRCGETTCAPLPPGVPSGQSGPRLLAFTGLLMGHFRQSKRRAAFFIQDLLGMPCCPALTVKMQNHVAQALAQPCEELTRSLADEPAVWMDETPTRQGPNKAWLWTAVAARFAVFSVFSSRKATALPKLLGENFRGVIHCDRAKMYWQAARLQWCWAHLKRDIQALIDHQDHQVKRLGHDLMRQVRLMFDIWSDFKSGRISRRTFRRRMEPIRREINSLLLRGAFSGNPRLTGMCDELHKHREWLWTFVDQTGIEPTNNTAERAIRPAVIYRKLSFGTQSASGSRFIERMLTVSETCRLQQRSIFGYLTAAVEAHLQSRPAPSLLPAA